MSFTVLPSASFTDSAPGSATTRTRCMPVGEDDVSFCGASATPGNGSSRSHQTSPPTATTAAATPSHVFT